jgi:hypothetical protein
VQTCGFVRGNVLCELGPHSLLVLECMVYYTKRFPCVAVRTNSSQTQKYRRLSLHSFEDGT